MVIEPIAWTNNQWKIWASFPRHTIEFVRGMKGLQPFFGFN
jgi:hypothetical protein